MTDSRDTSRNNESQHKSLVYLIMGSLLGSSGTGAAIAKISGGSEIFAISAFFGCIIAAIIVYSIYSHYENERSNKDREARNTENQMRMQNEEHKRKLKLKSLNKHYLIIMTDLGRSLSNAPLQVSPRKVLKNLARDLRQGWENLQAPGFEEEEEEVAKQFQLGVIEIAKKWEGFADKPPQEGNWLAT